MTDLKPCPFCGSTEVYRFKTGNRVRVECCNCSCQTNSYPDYGCDTAALHWNRRVTGSKSLRDTMKRYREKCGEPVVDDRMVE